MTKIVLNTITNSIDLSAINDNFDAIAEQINDNMLSRDGVDDNPNQMAVNLDMNGNNILNTNEIDAAAVKINGVDIGSLATNAEAAAASAAAALASQNEAASSATSSASSATSAATSASNASVSETNSASSAAVASDEADAAAASQTAAAGSAASALGSANDAAASVESIGTSVTDAANSATNAAASALSAQSSASSASASAISAAASAASILLPIPVASGGTGQTTALAGLAALGSLPFQCRFQYSSSTVCVLAPFQGNLVTVNGKIYALTTNVSFSSTGLAAATLYYAYVYDNGSGALAGEFSTTAYTIQAGTGAPYKTGDTTRLLVGMVYIVTAATFTDSASSRLVASYYNRRSRTTQANGSNTVTATTATLVGGTATNFLKWSDEAAQVSASGAISEGTAANASNMYSYLNGSAWPNSVVSPNYHSVASWGYPWATNGGVATDTSGNVEGLNVSQLYSSVSGGTATVTWSQFIRTNI